MNIWPILEEELERYRGAVLAVRQCLFNYESQCVCIINEIKGQSFDKSQGLFDKLYEIQDKLAIVKYRYEFPLTERLESFVYHFDRDDICSRELWYRKFRSGQTWPEE